MNIIDIAGAFCLISGAALGLLGAIGIHRFSDVFARIHAATKPVTLGLLLLLLGTGLALGDAGAAMKLLLAAILQLITAPFGMQMLGRAAYRSGSELAHDTIIDELTPAPESM